MLLPTLVAAVGLATPRVLPPECITTDGTVRYFAFGSNLLASKMDDRGDTQVIGRSPAVVPDHRLAFNMRMFPPLEPAMASIEASRGDVCEGVQYELTREGYEALWRSEGGAMERPGYEEMIVSTLIGGETVQAITLRAAPWMRLRRDAPPSARYKQIIVDGARELGLSDGYISRLAALPAASPSAALTAIARAHGVVALLLFRLGLKRALGPWRAACYALLRGRNSARSATLPSRMLDLAAEIGTAALLLPTAVLGATLRFVLTRCGKEQWVQFGPPQISKSASGDETNAAKGTEASADGAKGIEMPAAKASGSRSGVQGSRMSASGESSRHPKDFADLRDLAELKDVRDVPPGLLPSSVDGLVRAQQAEGLVHAQQADVQAVPWCEEGASRPAASKPAPVVDSRAANGELNTRKLGRRRRGGVSGSDALSDAVARWATADEGSMPLATAGASNRNGLNEEREEARAAVEAMLSRTAQADELAAAPTDLLDETTRAMQAAEAAEAEAAAAAARAAALRAIATQKAEDLQSAAACELMSRAMATWASREETERREEADLRAAVEQAMGSSQWSSDED